jgi:hypothetical protein
MSRIFIALPRLDDWINQGLARVDGMHLVLNDGPQFAMTEAVLFESLVSGEDSRTLLGRVKSVPQLHALAAEHYQDSVLFEDAAYKVAEGFIGEPR